MTPGEKLYNAIRLTLIEQYGPEFFKWSEIDQHNLIVATAREYLTRIKKNK